MKRHNNDAKNVAFYWRPFVYPMQWAYEPEDVPEWDMSRGCHWSEWRPHDDSYYQQVLKVDFRSRKAWREHNPEGVGSSWQVLPSPTEGFPRLVRRSLKDRVVEAPRTKDDILGELTTKTLSEGVSAWRVDKQVGEVLKKEILRLSQRYGPVLSMENNTLEAWLGLAAYVQAHMQARRWLQEYGSCFVGTDDYRDNRSASTVDRLRLEKERLEAKRSQGLNYFSGLDTIERGELVALISLYGAARKVQNESKPIEAFRREVARNLYSARFGEDAGRGKDEHLAFRDEGIVLRCSVGRWADYKLSEWWRNEGEVRICPACHTLFSPSRPNKKFCHANCRKNPKRPT